jgi:hypothetical protein
MHESAIVAALCKAMKTRANGDLGFWGKLPQFVTRGDATAQRMFLDICAVTISVLLRIAAHIDNAIGNLLKRKTGLT